MFFLVLICLRLRRRSQTNLFWLFVCNPALSWLQLCPDLLRSRHVTFIGVNIEDVIGYQRQQHHLGHDPPMVLLACRAAGFPLSGGKHHLSPVKSARYGRWQVKRVVVGTTDTASDNQNVWVRFRQLTEDSFFSLDEWLPTSWSVYMSVYVFIYFFIFLHSYYAFRQKVFCVQRHLW